jgi:hypothetical protein
MFEKISNWLRKHDIPQPIAWVVLVMLMPLLVFITLAIPGVVSNRSDKYLEDIIRFLTINQPAPGWLLVLIATLVYLGVIINLVVIGKQLSMRVQAQGKHRRASKVLDLSLLQLAVMVKMLANRNSTIDIENILNSFLTASVPAFSEGVYRASIFRPNTAGDYLEVWSHFGYNPDRLPNNRYCVAPTYTGKRGVAGYAFLERSLEYDRIRRQSDGKWMGEHTHFMATGNAMHEPHYKSFVAAPIKDSQDITRAVLCIDSDHVDAFDDVEDLVMIDNMASAIGPVILAYYELQPADAR